ncbi:MAG: hypothetical protein Q9195_007769 [Heterodermia aff. obscurata]
MDRLSNLDASNFFYLQGISANIRDAYSFICHNFSLENDEIVLIGFSRGAFTVRAVAAFIEDVGLLTKSGLRSLNIIYKLWKTKLDGPESKRIDTSRILNVELEILDKANPKERRKDIKVKVCAVWDTVGSLGFPAPDPFPQRYSKRLAHVNSTLCSNIKVGIQALALNERRKHFQPTVWKVNPAVEGQTLKQCWFLGTHSDVGGGNEDTGLANLTLVWMIAQLEKYVAFNKAPLFQFQSRRITATVNESREFSLSITGGVNMPRIGAGPVSVSASVSKDKKIVITPSRAQKSQGKIKNSMSGIFLLGGSRPRKPCQYLMCEKGLVRNPKDKPEVTQETIHFTVRILLETTLWTCSALKKYSRKESADELPKWTLKDKNRKETKIQLSEEPICETQFSILNEWMQAQKEATHNNKGLEDEDITLRDILMPLFAEAQKASSQPSMQIRYFNELQIGASD